MKEILFVLTLTTGLPNYAPSTVVVGKYTEQVCLAMAGRYERAKTRLSGLYFVALCNPEKAE